LAEGWPGRKKSMNKQWCRFCDKWHAPFNGHICDPEDLRRHVVALGNRADEAESVIDWLRTQAVADIAPGFVGIPQVEWDAVFAANATITGGDSRPVHGLVCETNQEDRT
jgi:hypothetical protein